MRRNLKRPYKNTPYRSPYAKRQMTGRRGYSTVNRTRGVYSKGEMKYFDTNRSGIAIAANADWTGTEADPATLNTLCVPTVGAAINQRIGREIKVYKIKIKGIIQAPNQASQSGGDAAQSCRLLLVLDTQTNASQMQGEQVIGSGNVADSLFSFQNLDNVGRFRVLKDKMMTMSNVNLAGSPTTGDVVQSGMARTFKISYKFRTPVSIRFNATNGGSVADIVDNSFHILINSSNAALSSTLSYQARVCYKE